LCTDFSSSMCVPVYLCVNRIFQILSIRRHSYFLFTARSAADWPSVNCACVRQRFKQLIRITLCPAFSGNFSVNHFAMYPFKYQLFIKILSSLVNTILIVVKHCSDVCCDEFSVQQIDRKANKRKVTWKILFAISMAKDLRF